VLGTVKSRLSAALNAQQRLSLYMRMLVHSILVAVSYRSADTVVCATPDTDHPLFNKLASEHDLSLTTQIDGDLGERMHDAAKRALKHHQAVLIMGSDCPFITQQHLQAAFLKLENNDLVLGPANDGGFVLIASKNAVFLEKVFAGVNWGEADVLKTVLANAENNQIGVGLLAALNDIDRPEDLHLIDNFTWFE